MVLSFLHEAKKIMLMISGKRRIGVKIRKNDMARSRCSVVVLKLLYLRSLAFVSILSNLLEGYELVSMIRLFHLNKSILELPKFKYSPNAFDLDLFINEEGICSVCAEKRELKYTSSFYSVE